ncbi:MAG: PIN domain-containing protein [Candidatus Omnitrophica bacterium]|nr:PIN domain-containing protein [Candidatus Omnitrophota bacterium]
MILVDSSVWIDYFRKSQNVQTDKLREALSQNKDLCVSGIIFTEVLQGIVSDGDYRQVKSMLEALILLPMPNEAYGLAADIYRRAKKNGHTIRNTVDCLIAACAVTHDVPLLHRDRDFLIIAKFSKIKLID